MGMCRSNMSMLLAFVLLQIIEYSEAGPVKRYIGYCNRLSNNCGAGCNSNADCQGGACWASQDTCSPTGYCNAASTNCGTPCNIQGDCISGNCWLNQQTCNTHSDAGYCNAASTNCGTPCNTQNNCPGGNCMSIQDSCGGSPSRVVGTYLGALPGGVSPPALSSIPTEINFVFLGFAKDANDNGNFQPFSEWTRLGITKASISTDKANNPNRKYMISLGGSAGYGGTFNIHASLSVNHWVTNAVESISKIVTNLNADGVDIQFEGGTSDSRFASAVTLLAQQLKNLGYITSFGPYYGNGGTWSDYVSLPMGNVDYIFCQFYANGLQTITSVVNDITQAAGELGGWNKLIAGFNSNNRNPSPSVSLKAVQQLQANLKGTFTWAAEHSQYNTPPYCIEKNSAKILKENQSPGSCNW